MKKFSLTNFTLNSQKSDFQFVLRDFELLNLIEDGNECKDLLTLIDILRVEKFLAEQMNWEMISQMNSKMNNHVKQEKRSFILFYFIIQRFDTSFMGLDLLLQENWAIFKFLDKLPSFGMGEEDLSILAKKTASSKMTNLLEEIYQGLESFKDPWGTLLSCTDMSPKEDYFMPVKNCSLISPVNSGPSFFIPKRQGVDVGICLGEEGSGKAEVLINLLSGIGLGDGQLFKIIETDETCSINGLIFYFKNNISAFAKLGSLIQNGESVDSLKIYLFQILFCAGKYGSNNGVGGRCLTIHQSWSKVNKIPALQRIIYPMTNKAAAFIYSNLKSVISFINYLTSSNRANDIDWLKIVKIICSNYNK